MSAGVPVEHLEAAVRLLYPEEMTPTAKRQLDRLCEMYSGLAGDPEMHWVHARTLWVGVQLARHIYRNTDDLNLRTHAAHFLGNMPAWMQQDDYRRPVR